MSILRRLALLLLLGLAAGGFVIYRLEQPYQGFQGETFVEFARGTSTGRIADALVRAGVVRSRWDFLLARAAQPRQGPASRRVPIREAASPMEVVRRIATRRHVLFELVVPEGRQSVRHRGVRRAARHLPRGEIHGGGRAIPP